MRTVTIRQTEAAPASYPNDADPAIWQRIEAYTAWRWTSRQVVWLVEGDGDWQAPLAPATLELVEVWDDGAWLDITPVASPWGGYDLPGSGPHRITATVGGGDCPAAVLEAVRRLAEYMAAVADIAPGASSSSLNIGQVQESTEVNPAHLGRALQNSGARRTCCGRFGAHGMELIDLFRQKGALQPISDLGRVTMMVIP